LAALAAIHWVHRVRPVPFFGSSFFGIVEVLAPVAARDLCPALLDGE
jgi:hypothetical protein